MPRHVGNYWSSYDAEINVSEPKPKKFCQYYMAGLKRAEHLGEAFPLVEMLAEGVIALARFAKPLAVGPNQRKHRYLTKMLSDNPDELAEYLEFITLFAVERIIPTSDEWKDKWAPLILFIASRISDSVIDAGEAAEFLQWEQASGAALMQRDNRFKYPEGSPTVEVRLGSIHSIKGETHTATLVCETYYRAHHLASLRDWLVGKNCGGEKLSDLAQSRLKLHYVAMTRPTHLLCIGMREDALKPKDIEALKSRRWRVGRVMSDAIQWI